MRHSRYLGVSQPTAQMRNIMQESMAVLHHACEQVKYFGDAFTDAISTVYMHSGYCARVHTSMQVLQIANTPDSCWTMISASWLRNLRMHFPGCLPACLTDADVWYSGHCNIGFGTLQQSYLGHCNTLSPGDCNRRA